jgi:hypothetical protein
VGGLAVLRPRSALAQRAVQRSLADFLSQQGQTAVFQPPVPDYIGWVSAVASPPVLFAQVDYPVLAAAFLSGYGISLSTTFTGSVSERPLADGRAEVMVNLLTTNALTWVCQLFPPTFDQFQGPELFGSRASAVALNPTLTPALGESNLQFVFKNPAMGAPLADIVRPLSWGWRRPARSWCPSRCTRTPQDRCMSLPVSDRRARRGKRP